MNDDIDGESPRPAPYPGRVTTGETLSDAATAPAPRRTRSGAVLVGPSIRARYLPGVLIGLPLISLLLSPFAGAGLQQWRRARILDGHRGQLEQMLEPAWTQLLVGALLLWGLFALWAFVPLVFTRRVALLDEQHGALALRKGMRTTDRARTDQVVYAVGEAERGSLALIGIRDDAAQERQWLIPEIGWDQASFDGLRMLQTAAGLRAAPPRRVLVDEARRARREQNNRELAQRLGMPWQPDYGHDEGAFQAEFDRVRRVVGGKEPPREGDPSAQL